jgi:hypothetical protein
MRIKIPTDENIANVCLYLIVLACFYYPFTACLIQVAGVPSTPINVGIKLLLSIISVYLFGLFLLKNKSFTFSKGIIALAFFWIFYFSHILFDIQRGVHFDEYSNVYVVTSVFGGIILPLLGIIPWISVVDFKKMVDIIFKLLVITNILIIATIVYVYKGFDMSVFMYRTELSLGESNNIILNAITISLAGEQLLVLSFYRVLFKKNSKIELLILCFLITIGFLNVFLGASRSPILGAFLIILLLLIFAFKVSRNKLKFTLKFIVGLASILVVSQNTILKSFSMEDFVILNRLILFSEDGIGDEYRATGIKSAWQDFLDNPILGKQFVGTFDNFYPHNLVVELFMATGVVGAILFFIFYFDVIVKLLNIFKMNPQSFQLIIVFLPIFLLSFTSGSLFQSIDFWIFSVVITKIPIRIKL